MVNLFIWKELLFFSFHRESSIDLSLRKGYFFIVKFGQSWDKGIVVSSWRVYRKIYIVNDIVSNVMIIHLSWEKLWERRIELEALVFLIRCSSNHSILLDRIVCACVCRDSLSLIIRIDTWEITLRTTFKIVITIDMNFEYIYRNVLSLCLRILKNFWRRKFSCVGKHVFKPWYFSEERERLDFYYFTECDDWRTKLHYLPARRWIL